MVDLKVDVLKWGYMRYFQSECSVLLRAPGIWPPQFGVAALEQITIVDKAAAKHTSAT